MKRILLIEDEEIMIDLLLRKLKSCGYEVIVARDGQEGLDLLRVKKVAPDLILMDIIMPKLNGFATMAEIQKDEELKTIPIIVISNSGQPVELDEAKRLGARDWLLKTEFDPQELVGKIKAIIA
jgi:CheY-like chemotaxis protein